MLPGSSYRRVPPNLTCLSRRDTWILGVRGSRQSQPDQHVQVRMRGQRVSSRPPRPLWSPSTCAHHGPVRPMILLGRPCSTRTPPPAQAERALPALAAVTLVRHWPPRNRTRPRDEGSDADEEFQRPRGKTRTRGHLRGRARAEAEESFPAEAAAHEKTRGKRFTINAKRLNTCICTERSTTKNAKPIARKRLNTYLN
jgi:hypothetical protein